MHIQYDRDEQDSMTCFTFDSTTEDQEQMRDLIDWLSGLGIRTSKTTIRAPGGGKMICLLVNNVIRETIQAPVKTLPAPVPTKSAPPVKDESESESEDEEPVVPATQKKPAPKPAVTKK